AFALAGHHHAPELAQLGLERRRAPGAALVGIPQKSRGEKTNCAFDLVHGAHRIGWWRQAGFWKAFRFMAPPGCESARVRARARRLSANAWAMKQSDNAWQLQESAPGRCAVPCSAG